MKVLFDFFKYDCFWRNNIFLIHGFSYLLYVLSILNMLILCILINNFNIWSLKMFLLLRRFFFFLLVLSHGAIACHVLGFVFFFLLWVTSIAMLYMGILWGLNWGGILPERICLCFYQAYGDVANSGALCYNYWIQVAEDK